MARHARPLVPRRATVDTTEAIEAGDATKLDSMLARFTAFDVDGNGQIDREELRALLESVDDGSSVMCQHWLPEEELDRVMNTYDKDQNGTIDFEEFQSIVYDGLLLDGMLEEYEAAFNAVDSSGNGSIGAMELLDVFKNMGISMSFEKLSDVMLQYDRDESGQIEFDEFLLMFRDELLDLKAIQSYMAGKPVMEDQSNAILDTPEGAVSIIFSEAELDEVLAQDKMVVVFSAMTWCRPCKAMQRPVAKMAEAYGQHYNFIKLFGNSNAQTKHMFKEKLKVRSTPCFMIFKGGEMVYCQTGRNSGALEDALRSFAPADQLPAERLYEPAPAPAV